MGNIYATKMNLITPQQTQISYISMILVIKY